ncbi:radical SAM protein [Ureibacillus sp. FSL K6-8385]|uniref:SPL family radical SAM protein n=1 Tax=Ureibacillus TaxID=160795 RepID=UPI0015EED03E|nr:radical SAM protein [Ureibacillus terrenus]MED3662183.1 radical SAM protein [Ureibacillus terrenus]MED3765161.1 radical SAM protein [Ureibacillus terrenus]
MAIQFKEIQSKTILTKTTGYLDIGFTHSLNPYAGCAFACRYCYVRELPIQKFKGTPWGGWVEIKRNAREVYRREIVKLRKKELPVNIYMSSATDPYQPVERKACITRGILEEMRANPPDILVIQTRGPLIERDIDVLVQLKEQCTLIVSMTIETDREDVKRIFAPYAPSIKMRMEALRKLHLAGITTQAAVSPALPFTPEFPKLLRGIADYIWIDTLAIGDGAQGKRSSRLKMPQLFAENNFSEWYQKDLHVKLEKFFKRHFQSERIRISRQEAFLN